ncbi:hypothetical protein [Paenarthrobacter sp. JL.01a]|uniref:hypothetical protein n=1 Tax=Paenarthrobacter sp. JL.01a TaxID=2979324 RepID=UPI0021C9D05C|nr:hypothetical protein [Paenarthrobacter sp. JL.01a]UXM92544.1 hypothetical protein N5P29_04240 [Paenarthrobacter sp. JL.01a]
MITENQAKALASLLHEIRPRWSAPAMLKLLEKNHTHPAPFADIAAAAVSAARDPLIDTPGAFLHDQRFWPQETRKHLPRPAPCQDHIGEPAHQCRCCNADYKAGIRPMDMIGRHYDPPNIYEPHIEDNKAPANAGA